MFLAWPTNVVRGPDYRPGEGAFSSVRQVENTEFIDRIDRKNPLPKFYCTYDGSLDSLRAAATLRLGLDAFILKV